MAAVAASAATVSDAGCPNSVPARPESGEVPEEVRRVFREEVLEVADQLVDLAINSEVLAGIAVTELVVDITEVGEEEEEVWELSCEVVVVVVVVVAGLDKAC